MSASNTPFLDKIKAIHQLREFLPQDLPLLAQELREETIQIVSQTGGHLGAGLGVIELTIALHFVFNTPVDKLIWDVGHQAYPHKIITDRRHKMLSLRQKDGISGFTKRGESEFDPFGAGHSSTSISAALGMAVARDLLKKKFEVIAVIGDGAMSAGLAYEAMNNAGSLKSRMLVILNDNDMSIAPPVGAMSAYLSRLISSHSYLSMRKFTKDVMQILPSGFEKLAKNAEKYAKTMAIEQSNFFQEMGFYYIGPIDGHNLDHLIPVLENIRDDNTLAHPVLLHVVTEKGHGFNSPEISQEKYHAMQKFDLETRKQEKKISTLPSYTQIFSQSLVKLADEHNNIVAITAAMPSGTGLEAMGKKYPDRMFDVGIAEQHAVTFAAGLACEGLMPFVAIYSTFLQRAYDQIIHDVVLQNLPVRFIIDRAGLVGGDGPTHAGAYDLAYLCCLPHVVIMAPANEIELIHMMKTMVYYDKGPIFMRYPRGEIVGLDMPEQGEVLPIGKGRIVQEGKEVAILSLGTRMKEVMIAAEFLTKQDIPVTVADARFAKPLDENLVSYLVENHELLIVVEEGVRGGFSGQILHFLAKKQYKAKIRVLCFPDYPIEQDEVYNMYETAEVNSRHIIEAVYNALPQLMKTYPISEETILC